MFSGSIPEIWSTNDFGQMLGRFETIVKGPPFAVYVWCQLPHTDANVALAFYARQIDELIAGGCAVSDTLLGAMLEILRRENRTDDTAAVVHGDHGDDYWTHGFKNGLLHGVEPFTAVIHAPLVILDRKLPQGRDGRLVSTVDLAPTCLDLLGMPWAPSFAPSGRSILDRERRSIAFSQNRTANQVLILKHAPQKCFSASDHSYNLLVSPRGLELYNYRVDPGNQFNILNFFNMTPDGELATVLPPYGARPHFNAFHHMWRGEGVRDAFRTLRTELREHVAAKSRYVTERVQGRPDLLDQAAFARINRSGWREFFRVPRWAGPGPGGRVSLRRLHKENIVELVGPVLQRLYRMIVRDRRRQGQ